MIPTTAPKTSKIGSYFCDKQAELEPMNPLQLATERARVDRELVIHPKGHALHVKAVWDDKMLKRLGV